jgi:hypothetical protein
MRLSFSQLSWLGLIVHVVNSMAVLLTAATADKVFTMPLTYSRTSGRPGQFKFIEPHVIWNVPLWVLVYMFSMLAALDHIIVIVGGCRRGGQVPALVAAKLVWWEYTFSASIMMVVILMLCGISDIFVLVLAARLYASAMETASVTDELHESFVTDEAGMWSLRQVPEGVPTDRNVIALIAGQLSRNGFHNTLAPWFPVWFACVASDPPGFVFGIVGSLFLLFGSFGVVQVAYLSGRIKTLVGRNKVLVWLSITAKTALVWQIYANALVA